MSILNISRGVLDMFDYSPLWETIRKKEMSQYQLIKEYNISTGTLDSLRQNRSITMHTLDNLCQILDCTPNDIVKIEKDNK